MKPFEPMNSATQDFHTDDGVRISQPLYLDLPNHKRKELLNALRETINNFRTSTSTPSTMSGISVSTYTSSSVEQYLGMNMDVLRGVLFQRGGLAADLILRIQAVTGVTIVTDAQLKKAFDERKKSVLAYVTNNPPPNQ